MADLLALKEMSPIEISGIGGKISTAIRSKLKLSSCTSGFETILEVFIMPAVITDQPSVPIATDLNIPEGLPLADPYFWQPGPIDLTLAVEVFSRVITRELQELGPNRPLAQGTRLDYVITGFLDKETSSDTEINPVLVEDRGDLARPNAAYVLKKDKNPMNDNHFDIEDIKRQNEISLDEEGIHLTNLALMDHKRKEPGDIYSQSRTSDTDSSDRGSTAIYNSSLQLTELYTTKEKPSNTEPTSHQLKINKKPDLCSTFLDVTKKYLSFLAESPHTIDVPIDQVLRGHNFSHHGNVNLITKVSFKQHQEDVKDLNHKHEPPQLKERSSSINDLCFLYNSAKG